MNNYDDIEIINDEATELSPNNNNAVLDTSYENILEMARRADEYVDATNRIMEAALKITSEYDWVNIGGKPYLQESGATKVARLFGISIEILPKYPIKETDIDGYVTYTYRMRMSLKGQSIDCEGSRSMKQDFFSGKDHKKKPDEIIERDVKMAAYTNCVNNGIKRIIPGLRNIDMDVLEKAGLNPNKIRGYTFKTGKQGGKNTTEPDSELLCEKCGKAVTQRVASYSQSKFDNRIYCMDCQKGVQQ